MTALIAIGILVLLFAAGVALEGRQARRPRNAYRRSRRCVPLRAWLLESRRLAWYRVTPRRCYRGDHEEAAMDAGERLAFARIVTAEKRRQPLAPEVRYEKRPR